MFSYANLLAEQLRFLGTIRYDVASIIKLMQRSFYDAQVTIDGKTFDIGLKKIANAFEKRAIDLFKST